MPLECVASRAASAPKGIPTRRTTGLGHGGYREVRGIRPSHGVRLSLVVQDVDIGWSAIPGLRCPGNRGHTRDTADPQTAPFRPQSSLYVPHRCCPTARGNRPISTLIWIPISTPAASTSFRFARRSALRALRACGCISLRAQERAARPSVLRLHFATRAGARCAPFGLALTSNEEAPAFWRGLRGRHPRRAPRASFVEGARAELDDCVLPGRIRWAGGGRHKASERLHRARRDLSILI
jgi:hypothetical protein